MQPPFPPELESEFEPLRLLGQGGMGVVFEARERALDRRVAVKCLRRLGSQEERLRFQREAAALAAVRHPHVLEVHRVGLVQDRLYMVMELLEGEALDRVEDQSRALRALRDVAGALDQVHACGLVHRDLKPANVFTTRDGRGVLLDFGLALDDRQTRLTEAGQVMGTLAFLAPETLTGSPHTPAADWYGWGASLFDVLTGGPPYTLDQLSAFACHRLALRPPTDPAIPPESPLAPILAGLLAADPGARPCGAARVLPALEATLADLPAGARRPRRARAAPSPGGLPPAAAPRPPDPARARRRLPPLALLGLGLLALVTLGLLAPRSGAPLPPVEPPPSAGASGGASPDEPPAARARVALAEISSRLEALLPLHLEACEAPPCPPALSTTEHMERVLPEIGPEDSVVPLLALLRRLDELQQGLPVELQDDPAVQALWGRLLVAGIDHFYGDLQRLSTGKGSLERGLSPERLEALARAFRNCRRTQAELVAWTQDLILRDAPARPWLLAILAQLRYPVGSEAQAALGRHMLERLRAGGTTGPEARDLAIGVLLAHPGRDPGAARCGLEDADGALVTANLSADPPRAPDAPPLLTHLGRVAAECPQDPAEVPLSMLRDFLAGAPAELVPATQVAEAERLLERVRHRPRAAAAARVLAELSWWVERRRSLDGEPPAVLRRLRPPPDPFELATALEALAPAASKALHRLRRLALAGLETGRLEADPELLRRLVAVAAALQEALRRPGEAPPDQDSQRESRAFQWRLFSPLRPPSATQLVVQLAFLEPETFAAASWLEVQVLEALEATPEGPLRELLRGTARGARTSVWRRPTAGAGGPAPLDPCAVHRGTLRAHEAGRDGGLDDELSFEPGAGVTRTLAAIECLSTCVPPSQCFDDLARARRWSLDIPLEARRSHGDAVRSACRRALGRLEARVMTREQDLLVEPILEACRPFTR